ncbi:hypothetical protein RvY_11132 [Ramazzottius varieornatus]|uniref:Uncharacterized protein n=1 Tax=Ramazzottius varieornatus TaxID=947166 RepID=A0A1D1VF34_RAMVA|nr:hypothetical protein RvY_11132 [Ramazzottius varieornatus]
MVSARDGFVGHVFRTPERRDVPNDTIIFFLSDNGGGGEEQAISGVQVPAFVWSPLIQSLVQYPANCTISLILLPTFFYVAGGSINGSLNLGGGNIWPSLSEDLPSPRKELPMQADATAGEYALRWNGYKVRSRMTVNAGGKEAHDCVACFCLFPLCRA